MDEIMPSHFTAAETQTFPGKHTLFHRTMLGPCVPLEVKDVTVSFVPYAQYANAVRVEFTKKNARTRRAYVETYQPSTVILPGWGHTLTQDAFTPYEKTETGALVSHGRHMSCDPAWGNEFNALLAAYCESKGVAPVLDARSHHVTTRP